MISFKTKIKYSINTNNAYYIKQGSKSKMSLMSPTSYQTAPSRVKLYSIFISTVWHLVARLVLFNLTLTGQRDCSIAQYKIFISSKHA